MFKNKYEHNTMRNDLGWFVPALAIGFVMFVVVIFILVVQILVITLSDSKDSAINESEVIEDKR